MLGPGLTARCLIAPGTPPSCPNKPHWGPDLPPAPSCIQPRQDRDRTHPRKKPAQ